MIYDYNTFDYAIIKDAEVLKRRRGNPSKRDNRRKYLDLLCAFDIETTNDDESRQSFMYVWQAQIEDVTIMGRTWDEFKRWLYRMAGLMDDDIYLVFWVHNLSFEFQFLRGIYDFSCDEVFAMDARKVLKCEMMAHFEFRCSYLQSNMSLAEFTSKMGVANAKLSGEDFDYSKARYPWTVLTDMEIAYCVNDVKGLVQAMRKQMDLDGDSLYTIPPTSTGYVRRDVRAAMRHANKDRLQATLPDYDLFCLLREAFRGGNTHANRYYSGLILKDVKSHDRASSYPDVQINCRYPVGPWIHEQEIDVDRAIRKIIAQGRACIFRIKLFNVRLKNPLWGCPYLAKAKCRDVVNGDNDNGRLLSADYLETTITDIDFKIIIGEYDFDYAEITDFYHSRYGMLPKSMKVCILQYFNDKTSLKGVPGQEIYYMKQKNKLNSIYGMSVQSPVKQTIDFYDEFITRNDDERELLEKSNARAFQSYAWGVWTTAHARMELEQAIRLVGDNFVYADTDSVKYLGDVDFGALNSELRARSERNGACAIDAKGRKHYLGVWEDDGSYSRFRTLGAKKYCYEDAEGLHITIAGVNKRKGASELSAHGGITAFHPGFVFKESAGIESIYNDHPEVSEIIREGRPVPITSNVYMYDSVYTLGITGEYMRILERAEDWRRAHKNY